MPEVLRFRPRFHVQPVSPETVVVLSEEGQSALHGALYRALADLLDGTRTADDLAGALEGRFPPEQVYYALQRLRDRGLVAPAEAGVPEEEAAFWDHLGAPPGAAARARRAPVAVQAVGEASAGPLREALEAAGLRVEEEAAFAVVAVDDYLQPELAEFNRARLAQGRAWMPVRLRGASVWVGPVLEPGRTACWECLARRLRGHREVEMFVAHQTGAAPPLARAAHPAARRLAADLAALEAARHLAGVGIPGRLLTWNLWEGAPETHEVVRLPFCPACGDPRPRQPAPPALGSPEPAPPGLRTVRAGDTWERWRRHVSPVLGAVRRVERLDCGSDDLHVYFSGVNFAAPGRHLEDVRMGLRSQCSGKGRTDQAARASAVAEALERYSGVFHGDEPRRTARREDLGDEAVDPRAWMQYSPRQYAERHARNPGAMHWIPRPFDDAEELEWTPLWSLAEERWRWLPTALCYYRYRLPEGREPFGFADSNGCAAGNTLEEAVLQGFLEVVERDAVALWWYNRLRPPRFDLAEVALPEVAPMLEAWDRSGRDVWALDLTTDLGLPVVATVSRCREGPEGILMGFGAHFDAGLAAARALTELNQSLPHFRVWRSGRGHLTAELADWWSRGRVEEHPYLAGDPSRKSRPRGEFPGGTFGGLVERCRDLAAAHGLEVLVLDQTRPEVGLPVARVVVPGLRHFWPRFAPGRLYDVPVALGWLGRPRAEEELNPEPFLL